MYSPEIQTVINRATVYGTEKATDVINQLRVESEYAFADDDEGVKSALLLLLRSEEAHPLNHHFANEHIEEHLPAETLIKLKRTSRTQCVEPNQATKPRSK